MVEGLVKKLKEPGNHTKDSAIRTAPQCSVSNREVRSCSPIRDAAASARPQTADNTRHGIRPPLSNKSAPETPEIEHVANATLKEIGIINLSKSFQVTKPQASLLQKGLTFVPTPDKTPIQSLREGSDKFIRNVKLKCCYFLQDRNRSVNTENRFRIPSVFQPPRGSYPPEVEELEITLKQQIRKLPCNIRNETPNLTKLESQAIKELKDNDNIIIKKADKGSAIVIMDRDDYVLEAERQLKVQRHYKEIAAPQYPDNCDIFNRILDKMHRLGLISTKERAFLCATPDARERIFYLLPKIHKEQTKWTVPHKIPPGRPIVSDVNSESYRIAQFIDYHLASYATGHPAFVKNTYDFLNKLDTITTNSQALLVSLDVDSLYTNIDNKLGIKAVSEAFSTDPKPIHPYIIQLLKLSLEGNDFQFNGKHYLQISGTAMGKKFAPHYADITMAYWERENLRKCDKQPTLYLRYLDDIFMIWEHTVADFEQAFQILNSAHPNITLKSNIQEQELEFLDVLVYKGRKFRESGRFDTKVYFKPTDSHALLHKKSYHPKHTFSGIVKSQLIRFARICNQVEDYNEATTTLFNALYKRGYAKRFLRQLRLSVAKTFFPGPGVVGMRPCGAAKCSICRWVHSETHLQLPNGEQLRLTAGGSCNTPAAVYALGCRKCPGLVYVGQSADLRRRLINHKSRIKTHPDTKIAMHFSKRHASEDVFVTILEIPSSRGSRLQAELLKLEAKWIKNLDTVSRGLNMEDSAPPTPDIPLILTHCPAGNMLTTHVKHWLENFNKVALPSKQKLDIIRAYGRNKNLSQHLVRASLEELDEAKS